MYAWTGFGAEASCAVDAIWAQLALCLRLSELCVAKALAAVDGYVVCKNTLLTSPSHLNSDRPRSGERALREFTGIRVLIAWALRAGGWDGRDLVVAIIKIRSGDEFAVVKG